MSTFFSSSQSNLTFWRDSNGNEVDVIMTEAEKQFAYEIKSGATFNKDFLKGLNYWGALSGADREHKSVIYGGENSMLLSDAKVIPWNGAVL